MNKRVLAEAFLITFAVWCLYIPIHETGHIVAALLVNDQIIAISLDLFNPHVTTLTADPLVASAGLVICTILAMPQLLARRWQFRYYGALFAYLNIFNIVSVSGDIKILMSLGLRAVIILLGVTNLLCILLFTKPIIERLVKTNQGKPKITIT